MAAIPLIQICYARDIKGAFDQECSGGRLKLLPTLTLSVTVLACSVGRQHTPDATLERFLSQHRAEFDALLDYVRADEKLSMVAFNEIRYGGQMVAPVRDVSEVARFGVSKERWKYYQSVLRQLELDRIFRSERGVMFVVDPHSLWNGDSSKGYWYGDRPQGRELASLDGYRIAEVDHITGGYTVSKSIGKGWYLYLFVSD